MTEILEQTGTDRDECIRSGCENPKKPSYILCEKHLERGGEMAALVAIMFLVMIALLGFAAGGGL